MHYLAALALSLESGSTLLFSILGGSAVFVVIGLLAARGYWGKSVVPLLRDEVKKWYDDPLQKQARETELQSQLRSPGIVTEQENAVKRIIEDQIQRKDGLINHEIVQQGVAVENRLLAKLEEVTKFLKEDSHFKEVMTQKLARIEGNLQILIPTRKAITLTPTDEVNKTR